MIIFALIAITIYELSKLAIRAFKAAVPAAFPTAEMLIAAEMEAIINTDHNYVNLCKENNAIR